jgi:hypothetical protein
MLNVENLGRNIGVIAKLTFANSPWVILNDLGGAFVMGAVGGGIWHSVKGAKNSPRVS